MLRLNYDIEKLKHFLYLAEQSQKEASEIIAELKAENAKLKERLSKLDRIINYCVVEDKDCPSCEFDKECNFYGYHSRTDYILKIIRGEEDE